MRFTRLDRGPLDIPFSGVGAIFIFFRAMLIDARESGRYRFERLFDYCPRVWVTSFEKENLFIFLDSY